MRRSRDAALSRRSNLIVGRCQLRGGGRCREHRRREHQPRNQAKPRHGRARLSRQSQPIHRTVCSECSRHVRFADVRTRGASQCASVLWTWFVAGVEGDLDWSGMRWSQTSPVSQDAFLELSPIGTVTATYRNDERREVRRKLAIQPLLTNANRAPGRTRQARLRMIFSGPGFARRGFNGSCRSRP